MRRDRREWRAWGGACGVSGLGGSVFWGLVQQTPRRNAMRLTTAVLLIVACGVGGANAQTYPVRPINMMVPFPPGGNTDIMARALQNELGKALGQTMVVVNKGGAAGTIGMIE